MRRKSSFIWTFIVMIYIGFIFHNSLTPAVQSSRQSGTVLTMVLAVFQSLGIRCEWLTEHLIRKMAHFGEYALLGVFLWKCLESYMLSRNLWLMAQLWLGTMIPLIDETLQLFTEGRSGQISDVWLDMFGAFTGSLMMAGIKSFFCKNSWTRRIFAAKKEKNHRKAKQHEQKYPNASSI